MYFASGAARNATAAGDVFAFSEFPERDFPQDGLLHLLRQNVGHVGHDEAGGDGVHRDAAARQFARERFRQANQPGFARRVIRLPRVARQAR